MTMPFLMGGLAGGVIGYLLKPNGQIQPVNLNELIRELKAQKPATYQLLELDAAEERVEHRIEVAGNTLIVLDDNSDTTFYVRVNEPDSQRINLRKVKKLIGGFYQIFVSNTAGTTGQLSLIAGRGLDVERSELVGSHNLLDDVNPDDHHAKQHAHDGVDGSGDLSSRYQLTSEKGQVNGYASLDSNGDVPDVQIPSTISRDSEIAATYLTQASAASTYQALSEKGAANGYASLDSNGDVPDAQIPSSITRDTELSAHAAAADPHTGYQKESEKGVANGYASLDINGDVPDAQIPSSVARDSEVSSSIASHAADADAHHAQDHAADHVGTGDQIDGDKLDIDWNPANYTPTDVVETDDTDDLSAHLKGIDDVLGGTARITTGTYTGDGVGLGQSITGIGFQPKYVKIWQKDINSGNSIDIWETTAEILDDHASEMSVSHLGAGGHQVIANEIISLDADGFTVSGAGSPPNSSGAVYNYLVIG